MEARGSYFLLCTTNSEVSERMHTIFLTNLAMSGFLRLGTQTEAEETRGDSIDDMIVERQMSVVI